MNVVSAPLAPLRQAVLEALREPLSATEVAARLGESHASASTTTCARWSAAGSWSWSRSGARRGCTERVVRATADAVVVEPAVVGTMPAEQDRFAADALLAERRPPGARRRRRAARRATSAASAC